MKKLCLFILAVTLILGTAVFSASAETTSLLPTDVSKWRKVDAGGESATVVIQDGATVVSGSVASWPNVTYTMTEDEYVTVPIKGYAIEYDISLDKGQTNVLILFKDGKNFQFPNCIDTPNKDPGSGDIKAGAYKGVITIEDMMKNQSFPANVANADDTITITGITIFTVSGATVTVNKFQIVEADESSVGSESEAGSESKSDSSSAVSSASSAASAAGASSAASSDKPASSAEASQPAEGASSAIWYYIIGGAAVVAIIIIVAVVVSKKKK
ncbi:MAG TPA: hypothetical protein PLD48_03250 [Bacillota bacterium]|nr:hypothetical protein [Bacillota bacterium]HOK68880.1 hypothetical protein [Bacillota bacterium]HPP84685.1 hypothetical protein [Bacillota bacterium]